MAKRTTKYTMIDGVPHFWFNWCTGYYTSEFCSKKLKELKEEYKGARRGSSVKDYNGNGEYVRYYRLQVLVQVGTK